MKNLSHPISRSLSRCILLCSMMLAGLCAAPVSAQSEAKPLPQSGINSTDIDTSAIRLQYSPQNKHLQFNHVANTRKKKIAHVKVTANTQNNQASPSVENMQDFVGNEPTDWIVMMDNSGSMSQKSHKTGQRRYLTEALEMTTTLLEKLDGEDSLTVLHFSQDMKQLGQQFYAGNEDSRAALKRALQTEAKKPGTQVGNTAMWHLMSQYVHNMDAPAQGRKQAILLLSDADDETSTANSFNDILATAIRRKISVHAVVFYHGNKNKGYNEVSEICAKTGGKFHDAGRQLSKENQNSLADSICAQQQGTYCNFVVDLSGVLPGSPLQLEFLDERRQKIGSLNFTPTALASIFPQAKPVNKEVLTMATETWKSLLAALNQHNKLAAAEAAKPADYAKVDKETAELRKLLPTLKEHLLKLKEKPADLRGIALHTIAPIKEDAIKQKARLINFYNQDNITADKLQEKELLALLGRNEPLAPEEAPAFTALLKSVSDAEPLVQALAKAEAEQPQKRENIEAALKPLKKAIADIHKQAKAAKALPADKLNTVLVLLTKRLANQSDQTPRLNRLHTFCHDRSFTAENITEAHILTLLGRHTPLPVPPPAKKGNWLQSLDIPVWSYWAFGGGFLLIIITLALILRSKSDAATPEEIAFPMVDLPPLPPEDPLPTELPHPMEQPQPAPDKLPAVVAANTANIPPHAILGTLTTGGASFWLLSRQITIGKDKSNHISILNKNVSRTHCCLKWLEPGKWEIIDLKSTNGVFAHGRKHTTLEVTSPTNFELGPVLLHLNPAPQHTKI